ncbi:MAG: glycerophosphodiester phosphodiesterase family protein [Candidatus Hydrogenedentota bacterium]
MLLRISVALTTLCVLLSGCAAQRYIPGQAGPGRGEIEVIAHRGASAQAPENTLAALQLAMEMGADWVHVNCRLSRDDKVVAIHDETLDRTTDGSGAVRRHTLEELKELDAGSWKGEEFVGEQIPTLAEVLDLARGRRGIISDTLDITPGRIGVYVELQPLRDDQPVESHIMGIAAQYEELLPEHSGRVYDLLEASRSPNFYLARRAVELIKQRNMERRVVVRSSSPVIIAAVRTIDRNIGTEYAGSVAPGDPEWGSFVHWAEITNTNGVSLDHERMTPQQLEYFQQEGRMVNAWTVNNRDAMQEMVEWGVDGLITDYPDEALDLLSEMGER